MVNYQQRQLIERELLLLIKRESSKQGDVKICPRNSDEHEICKLIISKRLMENGFKIYTEAELKKPYSGRVDIFAVKGNICFIYEVLNSETEKQFIDKIRTYPEAPKVIIIPIRVKGFNPKEFYI